MKCIKEEKLWEYLDGEVTMQEKYQIEQHLAECSCCEHEMAELMFFNQQFDNAVNCTEVETPIKKRLEEIELSYNEIKPKLKKHWRRIVGFAGITLLLTVLFVTLACPVSNKMIFESQFNSVTYTISQVLYFMVKPLIMNIWVIVLTFGFLFWLDKKIVFFRRQVG